MRSTADRFWAKVEKTDTCWLWVAYRVRKGLTPTDSDIGRKADEKYRAYVNQ